MSLNIKTIQVQINNLKVQQSKSLNNKTLSELPEQEQLAFCRRNKELGDLYYQGYLLLKEQKKYLEAAQYFDDALMLNNQNAWNIAKKSASNQSGITLAKSELNVTDSELYLSGLCYYYGIGKACNYNNAFVLIKKLAEKGYVRAQFYLGWMYKHGEGVKQDNALPLKWYRKAVEQGYAKAQFNLGSMYAGGEGVKKDKALAAKWYRKAAEQGYARAQYDLGWMYENGEGMKQDKPLAVNWYRRAAEQGYAKGQYNLGWMYHIGEGVKQSKQIAARWYRLAAEQGHSNGKLALYISVNIFMQYHSAALGGDGEKIKKLIHKQPVLITELLHDLSRVNENSSLFNLMASLIEPVLTSKPWPKDESLMRKLQFSYLKVMYQKISVDSILNEQHITKVINQLNDLNIAGLKTPQIKERLQLVSDFYFLIKERASISTHLAFKQVALIAIKRCLHQINTNQTSPANDGDDMHLLRQCATILIKALFGEEYEINFTITPRFNQLLGLLGLYQANPNLTPAQVNGMLAVNLIKPTQFKCGVEFIKAFQSYLNQETINNKSTAVTSLKSQLTGLLYKTENLTDENARVILDKLQAYVKDVLKKSALNPNGFFKIKGNDKELLECLSNQQYDFLLKYFNEVNANPDNNIQGNDSLQSMSR